MGFKRTLRKIKRGWPIVAAWIILSTIACWLHNFLWLGPSTKFHVTEKNPSSSVKLSDVNDLFSKDEIESLKKQYKSAQGK